MLKPNADEVVMQIDRKESCAYCTAEFKTKKKVEMQLKSLSCDSEIPLSQKGLFEMLCQ